MKQLCTFAVLFAFTSLCLSTFAEDPPPLPEMPKPQKEHAWLQQLAGEWTVESKMDMGDGSPAMAWSGTEVVRDIGGFWVVGEANGTVMDMPVTSLITLGYDSSQGKYVGTFLSDGMDFLWSYTGKVEGDKLILDTTGPCPMQGGKMTKFQEVIEIKNKNKRIFTSAMQMEDGSWKEIMRAEYNRKK